MKKIRLKFELFFFPVLHFDRVGVQKIVMHWFFLCEKKRFLWIYNINVFGLWFNRLSFSIDWWVLVDEQRCYWLPNQITACRFHAYSINFSHYHYHKFFVVTSIEFGRKLELRIFSLDQNEYIISSKSDVSVLLIKTKLRKHIHTW